LSQELAIYQELKNAISGENVILIKPSLDELNHSNAIKENIILKAHMLEEVRLNILKKIARNFDIKYQGNQTFRTSAIRRRAGQKRSGATLYCCRRCLIFIDKFRLIEYKETLKFHFRLSILLSESFYQGGKNDYNSLSGG
jgi:hypothetical protein